MNIIIKPESVNFAELVQTSKTKLSLTYQTALIDKLNKEFTEELDLVLTDKVEPTKETTTIQEPLKLVTPVAQPKKTRSTTSK